MEKLETMVRARGYDAMAWEFWAEDLAGDRHWAPSADEAEERAREASEELLELYPDAETLFLEVQAEREAEMYDDLREGLHW